MTVEKSQKSCCCYFEICLGRIHVHVVPDERQTWQQQEMVVDGCPIPSISELMRLDAVANLGMRFSPACCDIQQICLFPPVLLFVCFLFWTVGAGAADVSCWLDTESLRENPMFPFTCFGRSVLFRLQIKGCSVIKVFINSVAQPSLPLCPVHWQVTVGYYSFTTSTLPWQHAGPLNLSNLVLTRFSPRCFRSLEKATTSSPLSNPLNYLCGKCRCFDGSVGRLYWRPLGSRRGGTQHTQHS